MRGILENVTTSSVHVLFLYFFYIVLCLLTFKKTLYHDKQISQVGNATSTAPGINHLNSGKHKDLHHMWLKQFFSLKMDPKYVGLLHVKASLYGMGPF